LLGFKFRWKRGKLIARFLFPRYLVVWSSIALNAEHLTTTLTSALSAVISSPCNKPLRHHLPAGNLKSPWEVGHPRFKGPRSNLRPRQEGTAPERAGGSGRLRAALKGERASGCFCQCRLPHASPSALCPRAPGVYRFSYNYR